MDGQKKLSKMCAPFFSASQFYVPDWTVANHRRFRAFCAFPMVCLPSHSSFCLSAFAANPFLSSIWLVVVRANGMDETGQKMMQKCKKKGMGAAKRKTIQFPIHLRPKRWGRHGLAENHFFFRHPAAALISHGGKWNNVCRWEIGNCWKWQKNGMLKIWQSAIWMDSANWQWDYWGKGNTTSCCLLPLKTGQNQNAIGKSFFTVKIWLQNFVFLSCAGFVPNCGHVGKEMIKWNICELMAKLD